MANREKKILLGRRQTPASPVPPKEGTTPAGADTPPKLSAKAAGLDAVVTDDAKATASVKASVKNVSAIAKKLSKTAAKKAIKKNLTIQLKAKSKKATKINPKLTKAVLNNQKANLESKKTTLLKNGVVKVKQIRKPKVQVNPSKIIEEDDAPPVLEPIFPMEDNVADKKQPRKRINKKPTITTTSPSDDSKTVPIIVAPGDSINDAIQSIKKPKQAKKTKPENSLQETTNETLEEVMSDLSSLISKDQTEVQLEIPAKPKKYTKKQIDILRRKLIKKENIENTLSKLDPSQSSVIDMLDLNVQKLKVKPAKKRRHSIEKFPIGSIDNTDPPTIAQLTFFNNIPRSISPRTKRASKVRQSVDNLTRRSSPYTTRSDSPARILRNGKHRKLKDLNLFEGLDTQLKKRKRLCSDFSGSEQSVSKLSGYESDSSFSDLASLHGADNSEVKVETDNVDASPLNQLVSTVNDNPAAVITKRTLSTEVFENQEVKNTTDNNSNLCSTDTSTDNHKEILTAKEELLLPDTSAINPSVKVPDKSIILDIMKQTFNDVVIEEQDKEKRTTRSSARKTVKSGDENCVSPSKFYAIESSESAETVTKEENEPQSEENDTSEKPEEIAEKPVQEIEEEKIPSSEDKLQETTNETACIDDSTKECEVTEAVVEQQAIETTPTEDPLQTEHIEEDLVQIFEDKVAPLIEAEELPKENNMEARIEVIKPEIVETPENLAIKENILQALGLQSLKAAEEAKLKEKVTLKNDNYTGTLKTVIKLNRCDKKKGRNSLKMTLQKNKSKGLDVELTGGEDDIGYKIMKEVRKRYSIQISAYLKETIFCYSVNHRHHRIGSLTEKILQIRLVRTANHTILTALTWVITWFWAILPSYRTSCTVHHTQLVLIVIFHNSTIINKGVAFNSLLQF